MVLGSLLSEPVLPCRVVGAWLMLKQRHYRWYCHYHHRQSHSSFDRFLCRNSNKKYDVHTLRRSFFSAKQKCGPVNQIAMPQLYFGRGCFAECKFSSKSKLSKIETKLFSSQPTQDFSERDRRDRCPKKNLVHSKGRNVRKRVGTFGYALVSFALKCRNNSRPPSTLHHAIQIKGQKERKGKAKALGKETSGRSSSRTEEGIEPRE